VLSGKNPGDLPRVARHRDSICIAQANFAGRPPAISNRAEDCHAVGKSGSMVLAFRTEPKQIKL
jgi:hypothetical protein